MARPSRTSFAKREKEKARFEKRQQKLARRLQKPKDEEPTEGEAPTETGDPGESPAE